MPTQSCSRRWVPVTATDSGSGQEHAASERFPAEAGADEPATVAAVDLGSNSFHMIVARFADNRLMVLDRLKDSVRLAAGLDSRNCLTPEVMERALASLERMGERMRDLPDSNVRVVGTNTLRKARNGAELVERANALLGREVEIISGREEARLIYLGVSHSLEDNWDRRLVIDIGGGSTELIWIDLSGADPAERQRLLLALAPGAGGPDRSELRRAARLRIVDWISAPVGVATLHDRYADVTCDRTRLALMACHFEDHIAGFIPYEDEAHQALLPRLQIIGASGTVTTLGALRQGLAKYDRAKVDGMWLEREAAGALVRELIALGPEGRRAHPTLGPDRSDLVIAGAAILDTILRLWPAERLRVADRGLREGMLHSLMWAEREGRA